MKVIIITETENGQQIQQFENVEMIEYEDQTQINNGRWIHISQTDSDTFSVEIDEHDWFRIIQ